MYFIYKDNEDKVGDTYPIDKYETYGIFECETGRFNGAMTGDEILSESSLSLQNYVPSKGVYTAVDFYSQVRQSYFSVRITDSVLDCKMPPCIDIAMHKSEKVGYLSIGDYFAIPLHFGKSLTVCLSSKIFVETLFRAEYGLVLSGFEFKDDYFDFCIYNYVSFETKTYPLLARFRYWYKSKVLLYSTASDDWFNPKSASQFQYTDISEIAMKVLTGEIIDSRKRLKGEINQAYLHRMATNTRLRNIKWV